MLCRVAALKVAPYINHSAVYILFLILWDQWKYSEKLENINGLDSYILNRFVLFLSLLDLYQSLDWLLSPKLKVIVCSLSLSLSCVHCKFIQAHWRELIIRNGTVWPTLFLLNIFTSLIGSQFYTFIHRVFFFSYFGNMYPHSMFWAKIRKKKTKNNFSSEN